MVAANTKRGPSKAPKTAKETESVGDFADLGKASQRSSGLRESAAAKEATAAKRSAAARGARTSRSPGTSKTSKTSKTEKSSGGDGFVAPLPSGGIVPSATCLDQASGLYHPQHFNLSLSYEFSRMERTEKPLGLILVRYREPENSVLQKLAVFLRGALRPLDLAARLSEEEVAILIPEADKDKALRLLAALGREFGPKGSLCGPAVVFGAALAKPYQGGGPEDLVRRARENPGDAEAAAARISAVSSPWSEADTALAGEERDSLFSGFAALTGRTRS